MKVFATIVGASALWAGASVAATPTTIDFTDVDTWPDASPTPVIFDGIVVSVAPAGAITQNIPFDGPAGATDGLDEESDGFGIAPKDEIFIDPPSASKFITVSFSEAVRVVGLHFLDLFFAPNAPNQEVARAEFSGGQVLEFQSNEIFAPGGAGYQHPTFGPITATSVTFTVTGSNDDVGIGDYALAGLDVVPVPLPAAAWMLIAGLSGMALIARRGRTA